MRFGAKPAVSMMSLVFVAEHETPILSTWLDAD